MKFKDYYEIIGVASTATQEEIKRAYRKLARKYHPDVSTAADAETRFKELGEAHAVLKDPEKRAAYDQAARTAHAGEEFQPPPGWGEGFDFGKDDGMNYSDFFESLFGRKTGGPQQRDRHARGKDQHAKVLIDLEDAYLGVQRNISLHTPRMDAAGHTVMQERKLDVRIPRGMHAGQHLRLLGQGEAGTGGGAAGDLYLEIGFHPHAQYRIDVRDVFMDLPLAPWEAVLGCSLTLPTPQGLVSVSIPAGSVAGRQLRLKGRGIPGTPPGDLYAVLSIVFPPAVSESDRQAYLTLAGAFNFNPRLHLEGNSL